MVKDLSDRKYWVTKHTCKEKIASPTTTNIWELHSMQTVVTGEFHDKIVIIAVWMTRPGIEI